MSYSRVGRDRVVVRVGLDLMNELWRSSAIRVCSLNFSCSLFLVDPTSIIPYTLQALPHILITRYIRVNVHCYSIAFLGDSYIDLSFTEVQISISSKKFKFKVSVGTFFIFLHLLLWDTPRVGKLAYGHSRSKLTPSLQSHGPPRA